MNQNEIVEKKWSQRDKRILAIVVTLSSGIGAILGIIAYYQQWLG